MACMNEHKKRMAEKERARKLASAAAAIQGADVFALWKAQDGTWRFGPVDTAPRIDEYVTAWKGAE